MTANGMEHLQTSLLKRDKYINVDQPAENSRKLSKQEVIKTEYYKAASRIRSGHIQIIQIPSTNRQNTVTLMTYAT